MQPKKKGGRKPIYATSEERKQRNRQAQAAFRERRTEYIKQLEETIRVHEANMHNLQTANRTASEECLMLRYKNSLLERILLEKGIDVQAELHAKTGNPSSHVPQNLVQPPAPILRAIINPHHRQCKSISSIAPKTEPGMTPLTSALPPHKSAASPKSRPNPSLASSPGPSHAPSAFSPAPSDSISMRGPLTGLPRQSIPASTNHAPRPSLIHAPRNSPAGTGASFYPTPSFPNHMESLDHEYERQCDMVEDSEMDTQNDNGTYPPAFTHDNQQPTMLLSPTSTAPGHHIPSPHEQAQNTPMAVNSFPSMAQHLLDQSLDWDPFGLSASMAFPSQHTFQFDQENMR